MNSLSNIRILVNGIVQGVGFRPFIFTLAKEYDLKGWVINNSEGVLIEVEGHTQSAFDFVDSISSRAPQLARVDSVKVKSVKNISSISFLDFSIRKSEGGTNLTLISPDSVTCKDCLNEMFDPENRRYRYPFINCTNCGPRFSIIKKMPYDRQFTTMNSFKLCSLCETEYNNPIDRRFHAQPNACWQCGPQLQLVDSQGECIYSQDPIINVVEYIRSGKIIAVKGLGGFNIILDPTNDKAVDRLRRLKRRPSKPFAIMGQSIKALKELCKISRLEEEHLKSTSGPIVLCERLISSDILSDMVAPNNPKLGVMLPNNPVYHLLLEDLKFILCTSGNISGHPMEYRNVDALKRLSGIVDYFLLNDREINIRIDDSVILINTEEQRLFFSRRARGYAPSPITLPKRVDTDGIALGAELKNTVCLNRDNEFFISHYLGDLKNLDAYEAHSQTIDYMRNVLEIHPQFVACDMHPNFWNTKNSNSFGLPVYQIQHHHAHMVSCMADNALNDEKVIGVIFDGSGFGMDGNLWGGEFLIGDYTDFSRFGHFDYFNLIGGDQAVKQPFRIAFDLLYSIYGSAVFDLNLEFLMGISSLEKSVYSKMISNEINIFKTSSVGRLFDAVSALLQIRGSVEYEGQAAIELENEIYKSNNSESINLPYTIYNDFSELKINILPMINSLVELLREGKISKQILSRSFHDTLAAIVVEVCIRARDSLGINKVVLSGGVFQNQFLLNKCLALCKQKNFEVFFHKNIPTNDGGVSLGQGVITSSRIKKL